MTTWLTVKAWNEQHRELIASLRQAALGCASAEDAGAKAALSAAIARLAEATGAVHHYLAQSFTDPQKYACAHFHYSWLLDRLGPARVGALIAKDLEVWRLEHEGVVYSTDLRFEHWVAREGELTLESYIDKSVMCRLIFSVTPGSLFGLDAGAVILVGGLQGRAGQFEQIRQATKAMNEVSPRAALFAALAGVAAAVGIDHVVGVAGANHIGVLPDTREVFERQYDDFFRALDATPLAGGFHHIDLRAPAKPVTLQKTGHRVRTKRKRLFKQQLAETVARAWAANFPPPTEALVAAGVKPDRASA